MHDAACTFSFSLHKSLKWGAHSKRSKRRRTRAPKREGEGEGARPKRANLVHTLFMALQIYDRKNNSYTCVPVYCLLCACMPAPRSAQGMAQGRLITDSPTMYSATP